MGGIHPKEMEARGRFFKLLGLLSVRCNCELDVIEIEIYDKVLKEQGYDRVNRALEQIIIERRGRDPMPSPQEVMEKITPEVSPRTKATLVANRILSTIGNRGHNWMDTYKYQGYASFEMAKQTELGLEGAIVVALMGGWTRVCEESNDAEMGVFRAQLRDLALSVIEGKVNTERLQRQALPHAPAQVTPIQGLIGQAIHGMPMEEGGEEK